MAIAMAQLGGIGVIHKNLSVDDQASRVSRVKKFESGMVVDPLTLSPTATLGDALALMQAHKISGLPVVDPETEKLVGIVTNRDVRFASDHSTKVYELMTKDVVTVQEGISHEEARKTLHAHRIEKLLVTDEAGRCIGLITVKDIEKAQRFPDATKDAQGPIVRGRRNRHRPRWLGTLRGFVGCGLRCDCGGYGPWAFSGRFGSSRAGQKTLK